MENLYRKSEIPKHLQKYFEPAEIGLEETPELYVAKMVEVFTEVNRVLKNEGTLWLNIGDSYAGGGGGNYNKNGISQAGGQHITNIRNNSNWLKNNALKPKDLIGIPWMVAFALRSLGYYLRQDIIWAKPNPMPESVTDRCTKSHEYIFLLTKSPKYYYDYEAIKTEISDTTIKRLMQDTRWQQGSDRVPGKTNGNMKAVGTLRKGYEHRGTGDKKLGSHSGNYAADGSIIGGGMANKKSVWTVTTMPYSEAHFATFPERLIIDCIKAGCPEFVCNKCGKAREKIIDTIPGVSKDCPKTISAHEARGGVGKPSGTVGKSGSGRTDSSYEITGYTNCGCNEGFTPGIVLDPFMGAGTTGLVARKLNRNFVGFELNAEYVKIAEKRMLNELGMFN